jgi:hypothetical protein
VAIHDEQAKMPGAGQQELQRRDVPAVGSLDENAARDDKRARRWNIRSPFAVIGPESPSTCPKYIPFERSDT